MCPLRLLLPALLLTPACVVRAVQPEQPAGPTTVVYLVSAEGHTGILLPTDDGAWTEYAFGDFGWYAQGRSESAWTLYTALVDSAAALGRRRIAGDPLRDVWADARDHLLYPYRVADDDVARLRARLEAEFLAGGPPVFNPLFGLYFARAARPYSMWFNCTDATAEWLRELGIHADTDGICKRILGGRDEGLRPEGNPATPR